MIFFKENPSSPELCDSEPILGCFCREQKFQLFTVCLRKIKIWNIFNRKILKMFD